VYLCGYLALGSIEIKLCNQTYGCEISPEFVNEQCRSNRFKMAAV